MLAGAAPRPARDWSCSPTPAPAASTGGSSATSRTPATRHCREAAAKISDVQATNAAAFKQRLAQGRLILHLAEGTDKAARNHFLALQVGPGDWAISENLIGIHCVALTPADFAVVAAHGGAMVWSPLSNLLLYGQTADVGSAKREGIRIGLGGDWSPSGSKNLLGELKAAHLASAAAGGVFSDTELVAMATVDAAAMLGWDQVLGSLQPGKRADLIAVASAAADPYATLVHAGEADIELVVINGTPRVGTPALMAALGSIGESIAVGGQARVVDLSQATEDPVVGALSAAQATAALTDALAHLPELAAKTEPAPPAFAADEGEPVRWYLALDELVDTGMSVRPRLPLPGTTVPTGPALAPPAALPRSVVLEALTLDPLTVADDPNFLKSIGTETNLPAAISQGLATLYP